MSFLIGAVATVADELVSLPKNVVGGSCEVGKISLMAYRTLENVVSHPGEMVVGSVVDLTLGSKPVVALAAQVVLIVHKTFQLTNACCEVEYAFDKLVKAFTAPLGTRWLTQTGSLAPDKQNGLWVQFLTSRMTAPFVAHGVLRADLMCDAMGRLILKSLKVGLSSIELGMAVFIDKSATRFATQNMFAHSVQIYDELQVDPVRLLDEITINAQRVDDVFAFFGSGVRVSVLTPYIKEPIRLVVENKKPIAAIAHTFTETLQECSFLVVNMVLGIHFAPFGLPDRGQTQLIAGGKIVHVNSSGADPSRQGKFTKRKPKFFGFP